jgi:LPXTG-site transpeptidase (sortase) family protein
VRRRSTVIIGAGGLILLVGAGVTLEPWFEALGWRDSPAAVQAQRNAAAPEVVPLRPTPTLVREVALAGPTPIRALPTDVAPPTSAPTHSPSAGSAPPATPTPGESPASHLASAPTAPLPTPTLGPAELQLAEAAFQFQDPPQPGANVQLSVTIHNPTNAAGGPVSLDLPLAWLSGYDIEGIVPLPADGTLNGQRIDTSLRLTLDGPAAGDDLRVVVFLVTTDEVIDAPDVRVLDAQGRAVGHAHPPTEAPPGAPGPVYALDIPRLHLHAGVAQVDWEPPLFVVGQLRASAHVTEGNSVLVGHVRGAVGYNVFDHLDQLTVGDQIIASSRGQKYHFVVSRTQVLPEEDTSPTESAGAPRLTLMTCAGDWDPLTRDYPERLWVIAEPV